MCGYESVGAVQVTTIGGNGAITGVQILNYGGWTLNPTSPNTVCGGNGIGATLNLTFTLYWQNVAWIVPNSSGIQSMLDMIVQKPASVLLGGLAYVSITSGGSSYVVGDIITIAGGTLLTGAQASMLQVDAVSGTGAITACHILTYGGWSINPASPNAVSGGTGNSASLTLNFNAPVNRADKCIAMAVEKIQAAIRVAHRVPLSVTPLSIPPEAETHCYAMAIQLMIGALPSLQGYVTNPPQTSGKPPLVVLFEAAAEWCKMIRDGKACEYPADPDPTFTSSVREGWSSAPVDLNTEDWLGSPQPYGQWLEIGQP